jgi:hypothetical protein
MEPYQARVIEERDQLAERIAKLLEFFKSREFEHMAFEERKRLIDQAYYMHCYKAILDARIKAF